MKIFIFITCILINLCVSAQEKSMFCDEMLIKANNALKRRDWSIARDYCEAALPLCPDHQSDMNRALQKANKGVEHEKKKAKVNEEIAKRERDRVLQEQKKQSLILSFVQQNNFLQDNWTHNQIVDFNFVTIKLEEFVNGADSVPSMMKDTLLRRFFLMHNLFIRANNLLHIGFRDSAIGVFDRLLSMDRNFIEAREQKIVALLRMDANAGNNGKALIEINDIKNIDKNNNTAILNEALTLCRLGKYRQAKIVFEESAGKYFPFSDVSTDQISVDIIRSFGIKKFIIKAANYSDFLLLYNDCIDYFTGEKTMLASANIRSEAKMDITLYSILQVHRQLSSQPKDYGAYLALSDLWQSIGFQGLASQYAAQFTGLHDSIADPRYINFDQKFIEELMSRSISPIKYDNNGLQFFSNALKLFYQNDYNEAEVNIKKALSFEPENLQYLYYLSLILNNKRDSSSLEEAIKCLDICIRENPFHAELFSFRAWTKYYLYYSLHSEEQREKIVASAVLDLQKSAELNPLDFDLVRFNYYISYQNRNDEILPFFRRLLHFRSMDINLWNGLFKRRPDLLNGAIKTVLSQKE